MIQETEIEKTDYDMQAEARRRSFLERAAGVITAAAAFVTVKHNRLRHSLRGYLHDRLHNRNWAEGNLERVLGEIASGKSDTYTGAPIRPATIREYSESFLKGEVDSMPGTLVGDPHAFAAFKHIVSNKPEYYTKAIDSFAEHLAKLADKHMQRVANLQKKFFKEETAEQTKAVTWVVEEAFRMEGDLPAKTKAIEALVKGGVFKDEKHLTLEDLLSQKQWAGGDKSALDALANSYFKGDHESGWAMVKALEDCYREHHIKHTVRVKSLAEKRVDQFHKLRGVSLRNHTLADTFFKQLDAAGEDKAALDKLATMHFIPGQHEEAWKKINEMQANYTKDMDTANTRFQEVEHKRRAAFEALKGDKLFKDDAHKFFERKSREDNNFLHFSNQAKKKLFDIPVFDEMIKNGKFEAGHMGLNLRHAHDKERILALSAGAAVTLGAIAYKTTSRYLSRNDHRTDQYGAAANEPYYAKNVVSLAPKAEQSFQDAVIQQRDSRSKQPQQSVTSYV